MLNDRPKFESDSDTFGGPFFGLRYTPLIHMHYIFIHVHFSKNGFRGCCTRHYLWLAGTFLKQIFKENNRYTNKLHSESRLSTGL